MTIIDLDSPRRCLRCHGPVAVADLRTDDLGRFWRPLCRDCADADTFILGVAAEYAEHRTRVAGALSLLRLGCPKAAALILEGHPWPTLAAARAMQRRVSP